MIHLIGMFRGDVAISECMEVEGAPSATLTDDVMESDCIPCLRHRAKSEAATASLAVSLVDAARHHRSHKEIDR